jgi:hypothetical protein
MTYWSLNQQYADEISLDAVILLRLSKALMRYPRPIKEGGQFIKEVNQFPTPNTTRTRRDATAQL